MELELSVYAILFCVAIFAGFIDSIVGGGGLITIPALMASGIPPHLALATNKLQSVFGSFTAAATYFRSTTLPHLAWGVFFTALGAAFGTWSVLLIKDEHLKLIILIFLSLTFLYTAFKPSLGKRESEPKIHNIKIFHLIFGLTLGFLRWFFRSWDRVFLDFCLCVIFGF